MNFRLYCSYLAYLLEQNNRQIIIFKNIHKTINYNFTKAQTKILFYKLNSFSF